MQSYDWSNVTTGIWKGYNMSTLAYMLEFMIASMINLEDTYIILYV